MFNSLIISLLKCKQVLIWRVYFVFSSDAKKKSLYNNLCTYLIHIQFVRCSLRHNVVAAPLWLWCKNLRSVVCMYYSGIASARSSYRYARMLYAIIPQSNVVYVNVVGVCTYNWFFIPSFHGQRQRKYSISRDIINVVLNDIWYVFYIIIFWIVFCIFAA